jgi:hypothetical protein
MTIWHWILANPQLASAGIASLAFCVALWQLASARAHNRRSVRPLLGLTVSHGQEEDDSGALNFHFELQLRNAGLGPAIVEEGLLSLKSGTYQPITNDTFEEILKQLKLYPGTKKTTQAVEKKKVIARDEEITILGFRATGEEASEVLKQSLSGLSFQVKIAYRSLHDERFVLDNMLD